MHQPAIQLTPAEARARVAALRAMSRAKESRFDAALTAFREALRLDPALKLAAIPDFWSLPSEGHDAAIAAYEEEGREHDAAMLMAMRRRRFRPRLVNE